MEMGERAAANVLVPFDQSAVEAATIGAHNLCHFS